MQCLMCHKGVQYGHNVSHSKRRTVRTFRPNLHSAKVVINGAPKRVKLCTKCLRMYKRTSVVMAEIEAEQTPAPEATAQS